MSKQKILILGWDGYIGFPLTLRCIAKGHTVHGVDNYARRFLVRSRGSISATDIDSPKDRSKFLSSVGDFTCHEKDVITDRAYIDKLIKSEKFDTIVNLAHNPSAPFSMVDYDNADYVLRNNILGTNNLLWAISQYSPGSHYITIGSTGEYDHTIGVDIEEGYFKFDHKGRTSKECLFPRQGNSIYHVSKVASTYLIDYLARIWCLRCTDIMQSIVLGSYTDELHEYNKFTRCDTDECFGTVVNRFVVQALVGEPLTIFGYGDHKRAFLSLNDSIQALEIAINNPSGSGKVQTWNQLSEWHSISEIASMVMSVIPFSSSINIDSPRKEFTGDHYYHFETNNLKSLGYTPTRTIIEEIEYMASVINIGDNKEKLQSVIKPKVIF